jgi:hypothetical protein
MADIRPIAGLQGYFISDCGDVFRDRNDKHFRGRFKIKCRKINGYWCFSSARKLGGKIKKVHRVICEAFNGPPPFSGALVRHLDDNRDNNSSGNLAWGTVKDNSADAKRNGVNSTEVLKLGEEHYMAKLYEHDALDIRFALSNGARGCDLADAYGVSRATITNIRKRKVWTHI